MRNIVLALTICSFSSGAWASLYCGELDESREWFETKVTSESTSSALDKLTAFNNEVSGVDFIAAENALRIVEARMYIKFIEASKTEFGVEDSVLIDQYCGFLDDQGYFAH